MSAALLQTSNTQFAASSKPAYPFLSQPPPPQKKRPTQPLPSPPYQAPNSPPAFSGRPRSATTSAISAWIANVHPGSPAPLSPQRRPSLSVRRGSISSVRVHSASFLNILDTPSTASRLTPSSRDFKPDLTAVGYTSVFVHFPETPASAAVGFPAKDAIPVPPIPESPIKSAPRGLKRFRSLGALKSRARSKSTSRATPSSPPPPLPMKIKSSNATSQTQTVSSKKQSKAAKSRPMPLASEIALAQFLDGGKIEHHIQNYVDSQAKAAGARRGVDGKLVGVGGVWQDGEGGVWRDQDEEWEYAHLLEGKDVIASSPGSGTGGWVDFHTTSSVSEEGEGRRGSVSTADSDLDPRFAMHHEYDARDDLAAFGGVPSRAATRGPGVSVLALPSRARRTAPHLRKPEFLLDVFPVPESEVAVAPPAHAQAQAQAQAQAKARRRPAPLALAPPSPANKKPTNPSDQPVEQGRKDFLDASFHPRSEQHSSSKSKSAQAPRERQAVSPRTETMKRTPLKPSMLNVNVRSLMRAIGGKKSEL